MSAPIEFDWDGIANGSTYTVADKYAQRVSYDVPPGVIEAIGRDRAGTSIWRLWRNGLVDIVVRRGDDSPLIVTTDQQHAEWRQLTTLYAVIEQNAEAMTMCFVPCRMCGTTYVFEVPQNELRSWQNSNQPIQKAMPSATVEQRELLLTQTCPVCFDKVTVELEVDEEVTDAPSS